MIKTELFITRADGVKLYRTYSDAGTMILQNETGLSYAEAVDVEGAAYTYTETNTPTETEEAEDMRNALDMLG